MSRYRIRNFFKVKIEYGYYDGFCITVDSDAYSIDVDNSTSDYAEALTEIEDIKNALQKLLDIGLVVTFPGWCTKQIEDYEENLQYINNIIEDMRKDIKALPTEEYNEQSENPHEDRGVPNRKMRKIHIVRRF